LGKKPTAKEKAARLEEKETEQAIAEVESMQQQEMQMRIEAELEVIRRDEKERKREDRKQRASDRLRVAVVDQRIKTLQEYLGQISQDQSLKLTTRLVDQAKARAQKAAQELSQGFKGRGFLSQACNKIEEKGGPFLRRLRTRTIVWQAEEQDFQKVQIGNQLADAVGEPKVSPSELQMSVTEKKGQAEENNISEPNLARIERRWMKEAMMKREEIINDMRAELKTSDDTVSKLF
jgi:hypothetical protein